MRPGEIYWADLGSGRRPVIIVSRESLNRGSYAVAVLLTTADFATRSQLPHCVPFAAGEFGLPKDCVAQCETISSLERVVIDEAAGPVGLVDEERMRALVQAIEFVIESECEPSD